MFKCAGPHIQCVSNVSQMCFACVQMCSNVHLSKLKVTAFQGAYCQFHDTIMWMIVFNMSEYRQSGILVAEWLANARRCRGRSPHMEC